MAVKADEMRDTLRLWASGVTVVTTSHGDRRAGMTVSAFSSLCLEPPLVVVCIFKNTQVGKMIEESGKFAVSILHADQSYISDRFSGRIVLAPGEDRFDGVRYTQGEGGSPVLTDAIAWLDCRLHAQYDGETHWIFVGEVMATQRRLTDNAPLIYFDRDYRAFERQPEQP
jgi:flavin reductase (DIM6/NTAB) family NADH-FMN oxidoreductase RutF